MGWQEQQAASERATSSAKWNKIGKRGSEPIRSARIATHPIAAQRKRAAMLHSERPRRATKLTGGRWRMQAGNFTRISCARRRHPAHASGVRRAGRHPNRVMCLRDRPVEPARHHKGGRLLFALVVIGGIIAVANKSPSTPDNSTQAPIQTGTPPTVPNMSSPTDNGPVGQAATVWQRGNVLVNEHGVIVARADPDAAVPAVNASTQAAAKKPLAVSVGVQPDGSVATVTPDTGDPSLTAAAITAAKQFTFTPYPYEAGKPVHTYRILLTFILRPLPIVHHRATQDTLASRSNRRQPFMTAFPSGRSLRELIGFLPKYRCARKEFAV